MRLNEIYNSDYESDSDNEMIDDEEQEEIDPRIITWGKSYKFKAHDLEETYLSKFNAADPTCVRIFQKVDNAVAHMKYHAEIQTDYQAAAAEHGADEIDRKVGCSWMCRNMYKTFGTTMQKGGRLIGWNNNADYEEHLDTKDYDVELAAGSRRRTQLEKPLLLRIETPSLAGITRQFTYFPIAAMATNYLRVMAAAGTSSIHEVCEDKMGNIRRMFFDLDHDAETKSEAEFMSGVMALINKFLSVMYDSVAAPADRVAEFRIYTSHGLTKSGSMKYSAHVICNNIYFTNSTDIARFVKTHFRGMRYFDDQPYKKSSSLRMFGFSKVTSAGAERQKILHSAFTVPLNNVSSGAVQQYYEEGITRDAKMTDKNILDSLITHFDVNEAELAFFVDGARLRYDYLCRVHAESGYGAYIAELINEPDKDWVYQNVLEPSLDYFQSDEYDSVAHAGAEEYCDLPIALPYGDDKEGIVYELFNETDNVWCFTQLMREYYKKMIPEGRVKAIIDAARPLCPDIASFNYSGSDSKAAPIDGVMTLEQEQTAIAPLTAQIATIKAYRSSALRGAEATAYRKLSQEAKDAATQARKDQVTAHEQQIATIKQTNKERRASAKPHPEFVINFERKPHAAHNCSVCKRTHNGDKRTMLWSVLSDGTVYQCCTHNRGPAKKPSIRLIEGSYKPPKKPFDQVIEAAKSNFTSPFAVEHDRVRVINEAVLAAPFEFDHTLLVDSGMGTGKTQNNLRYIRDNRVRRCVIISFRISYTHEMLSKYAEFGLKSYQEDGFLDSPFIIIQYESAHRLFERGHIKFDLLILDELEQIINCADNRNAQDPHRTYYPNFKAIETLLNETPQVIVMDATPGPRSVGLLDDMRPGWEYLRNEHKSQVGTNYTIFENEANFDEAIYADLAAGLKLVLPTTSKTKARLLQDNITIRFPALRVLRIDGENSRDAAIVEIMRDVNTHLVNFDVFIYTSTIIAGVSFIQHHFDALYEYISPLSCDTNTAMQMQKRVRDIATKRIGIYVKPNGMLAGHTPLTVDEIGAAFMAQLKLLKRDKIISDEDIKRFKHELQPVLGFAAKDFITTAAFNAGDFNTSKPSAASFRSARNADSSRSHEVPDWRNNKYFMFKIRQWQHKAFSSQNFLPYLLHFITATGATIVPHMKTAPNRDQVVEAAVAEETKRRKALRNADILALVPTADEVLRDDPAMFGRLYEAGEALEEDTKGKSPDKVPYKDKERYSRIKKLYEIGYTGPATTEGIDAAIDAYYTFRTISRINSKPTIPAYVESMKKWAASKTYNNMESISGNSLAVDAEQLHAVEDTKNIYPIEAASDILRILGYDVDRVGGTVNELNASTRMRKDMIVAKRQELHNYLNDPARNLETILKKRKNQLNVATKEFKQLNEFINSALACIGMKFVRSGDDARAKREPDAALELAWTANVSADVAIEREFEDDPTSAAIRTCKIRYCA